MGKRKPSGDLSEAGSLREDVRSVVMQQPHRRWLEGGACRDQRAESEVGRMFLAGKLSEPKYWAAERWHSLVQQFHVVLASPIVAGSMLGRVVAAGVGQDEASGTSERPESEAERRARVLAQHGRAMDAIRALERFPLVFDAMEQVILRGRPCGQREFDHLDRGLGALCRLWRMGEADQGVGRIRGDRDERPTWDHDEREVHIHYAEPIDEGMRQP